MAQAAFSTPLPERAATDGAPTGERTYWRWAGGFGLAHVVVMLGAFSLEGVFGGVAWSRTAQTFAGYSMNRMYYASFVEAMAFVLLVPALVILARRLRHTETSRVASLCAVGLGTAYVGATLAIGFPPLTAATYAAHQGADNAVVAGISLLRDHGYVLQVALSFAFTLALGVAALAERTLTRWLGVGGVGLGAVGLVVTPFAHNAMNLVWMLWWVILCVLCLRGGPARA